LVSVVFVSRRIPSFVINADVGHKKWINGLIEVVFELLMVLQRNAISGLTIFRGLTAAQVTNIFLLKQTDSHVSIPECLIRSVTTPRMLLKYAFCPTLPTLLPDKAARGRPGGLPGGLP
jgi:hypothetical protein